MDSTQLCIQVGPKSPLKMTILGVGEVHVPLSLECVKTLYHEAFATCGESNGAVNKSKISSRYIEKNRIMILPSSSFNQVLLSNIEQILAQQQIGLRAINGTFCLHQMVIYQSGDHFAPCKHKAQEQGHFGTIRLQIPVEGGHKGGRLTVRQHIEEKSDLTLYSDRLFYVSFITVGSEHWMEPITEGYRVELVFNLLWKKQGYGKVPSDISLSQFLVTLTRMALEFRAWQQKMDRNPWAAKLMVVGLEGDYDPERLTFARLERIDKHTTELICATGLVDVHLARLTRRVSYTLQNGGTLRGITYSATHWKVVHGGDDYQDLDIQKEAKIFPNLFDELPENPPILEDDCHHSETSHRSVLVVWPKKVSFYFDIRYRFDYILDELESDGMANPVARLRQIITDPVWDLTAFRIQRLLNLCLLLKAKEEVRLLLNLLIDRSVGVPSHGVAYLVGRIGSDFIGSKDLEETINKLMNCRPAEQLAYFATLAETLYDRQIPLYDTVFHHTWKLFIKDVKAATVTDHRVFVHCLQMLAGCSPKTAESTELSSSALSTLSELFFLLKSWPLEQLSRLIIDLKDVGSGLVKCLCLNLCVFVAANIRPWSEKMTDYVVDLVGCVLDLRCHEITELFINNLCLPVSEPGLSYSLLEAVVDSLDTIQLPSAMVIQLLDARIATLAVDEEPEFSWEQTGADFPGAQQYPAVLEFLKSSSQSTTVCFPNVRDARAFVSDHFSDVTHCLERGYSATSVATGKGKYSKCVITKTRHLHQHIVSQLRVKNKNVEQLKQRLLQRKASLTRLQSPVVSSSCPLMIE